MSSHYEPGTGPSRPRAVISPRTLARLNGWACLLWIGLVVPTVLVWSKSILWIGFMSVYAIVVAHYTAWRALRGEVRTEHVERQQDGSTS